MRGGWGAGGESRKPRGRTDGFAVLVGLRSTALDEEKGYCSDDMTAVKW